jgi:hypothetical protein
MNTKPRVLHVFHGLGMGGAETWIKELVLWDNQNNLLNFRIDILITGDQVEYWDETLKCVGVDIHYIALGNGNVYSFFKSFRKLLLEKNYCAIHDHQELFAGWHFLFGFGVLPKICVAHFHNPTYQMISNYGSDIISRAKLKLGKFFIYLFSTHVRGTSIYVLQKSGFLKKIYSRHDPQALHCSFDFKNYSSTYLESTLRDELNINENSKIVLVVGRFDYNIIENHPQNHKNTAFTLGVLHELLDEDIIFVYVGANHYSIQEFYSLSNKLKITHKLRVLGIRKDVNILMQQSNMLFFPSREEGLGMVAVEAQVARLPVLISNGVPIECKIVDTLVYQLDLSLPKDIWAKKIIDILRANIIYPDVEEVLDKSGFNIQNTHKVLNSLYGLE